MCNAIQSVRCIAIPKRYDSWEAVSGVAGQAHWYCGLIEKLLDKPFALSFIVTGLVWQWILNPQFGVQQIVRDLGFENFVFDPLYNSDIVSLFKK